MAQQALLGIIGGTGLYRMAGLTVEDEVSVSTPFGPPSDSYILGSLGGRRVVFLPRHGRDHGLLPSEVNYRANVYGLKRLGVERVVAVSAVGSMKEEIEPRHVVLPDQFIDRTHGRAGTFFGEGVVAHVSFADPVCPDLHAALVRAGQACRTTVWPSGTYVCIQGPAFSARAESLLYRSWGVSVIGMTNLPEARLAREAQMCYATVALVTDFDCWHQTEEEVSAELILENLKQNAATAQQIIRALLPLLPAGRSCECAHALKKALVTPPDRIPEAARRRLDILLPPYIK